MYNLVDFEEEGVKFIMWSQLWPCKVIAQIETVELIANTSMIVQTYTIKKCISYVFWRYIFSLVHRFHRHDNWYIVCIYCNGDLLFKHESWENHDYYIVYFLSVGLWRSKFRLIHWGRVMHICVSKLNQHWFTQWLVAWSAQRHYLNQYWDIFIRPLGTNFSGMFI